MSLFPSFHQRIAMKREERTLFGFTRSCGMCRALGIPLRSDPFLRIFYTPRPRQSEGLDIQPIDDHPLCTSVNG